MRTMKHLHYFLKIFSLLMLLPFSSIAQDKPNPRGKGPLDLPKAHRQLENRDIWMGRSRFDVDYVYAVRSMNDGEHFSALENNKIVKYSFKEFGESSEVIWDGNSENLSVDDYSFNADETKLLIATERQSIYRRSYTANYYVVDLETKKVQALYDKKEQMLADFSPNGNMVAFVFENNIYYKDLMSGDVTQVTADGEVNAIINGSADWVYEEEFEVTKAFYWSPGSTKIAYLKFDEREVPEFTMEYNYGETYPSPYTFKYPKAGEANSQLSLHIFNLKTQKAKEVVTGPYEYVPRMKWTNDDDKLIFLVMNRHQNELNYVMSEVQADGTAEGKVFYTDKSDTYVEVDNNLIFLPDGESFLRTSEKSGYRHIYKVGFDGSEEQITSGNWDVIELKGLGPKGKTIYYTSAEEGAIYQSVYKIRTDGKKKEKLSQQKGHNDASFSEGMKYYINYYSNASKPHEIALFDSKGNQLKMLKDNMRVRAMMSKWDFSPKEFITLPGVEHDLNAFMIKPPNFDSTKKYPVYFNIYNGPGHNTVADKWGGKNYIYHQLLAQRGYIVMSVDTRGTAHRGAAFKKSTYMQLGKLETEDMIAAAKAVQQWSFVDPNRIGVMGWSYGGYMTSLCMTKGADVFKMGIAVAPVTNWRWYDNIYTERFMRTPAENAEGYDDNSPINHVDKLKGKYLIVHGSGDDNVHVQNTLEMVNALVKADKDFDMFIYPNRNHGIYGGNTRLHLFNMLLDFTLENL